jgi:hypothetical protein
MGASAISLTLTVVDFALVFRTSNILIVNVFLSVWWCGRMPYISPCVAALRRFVREASAGAAGVGSVERTSGGSCLAPPSIEEFADDAKSSSATTAESATFP